MRCRDASAADALAIDALYRAVFEQTFRHLYSQENYESFMGRFSVEEWRRQLADPGYAFRIAENPDGRPVGFVKVGPMDLPAGEGERAMELYNLYLLDEARGTGVADELTRWAARTARAMGGEALFLSVFTENHRARRFYQRHGFTEVGPYAFMVGDHVDEDIIMRLDLNAVP